jgi:hypothetical protein
MNLFKKLLKRIKDEMLHRRLQKAANEARERVSKMSPVEKDKLVEHGMKRINEGKCKCNCKNKEK